MARNPIVRVSRKLDEEIRRFQQRVKEKEGKDMGYTSASESLAKIIGKVDFVEVNIQKKNKKKHRAEFEFKL